MPSPSPERLAEVMETERRPGVDMYGIDMGHLVMPNGSLIAVWQGDDDLAVALAAAYRDEILNQPTKEHTE